jgi:predicted ribonuclease YlaK
MIDWFAGFLSSLYYIYANTRGQKKCNVQYDYVKDTIFKDTFETIPLNAIQGMSLIKDDILIVDEVQLINIDYLSMILSRGGSNSKIILLGDLFQTYDVVRPSESGLLKLLRILPHESLSFVRLENSYRSNLLELADKLQDNTINV